MSQENNENITLIQCPFCAEKINAFAKKCRFCGEIVDPALRIASDMQSSRAVKVNIVSGSGTIAAPTPQVQPTDNISINTSNQKQRVTYILLGVFLGTLGIHNFYAEYTGRGIAQLLITLLTGWLIIPYIAVAIWSIVEVCTINKDANGIPFC